MKKLLSVLLAVAMFAALLSFGASAQDNKVDQTPRTTVYVSNAGDDSTAEAGNKEKPFKDFLTAYGKLAETGGTVVLLDDVEVDLSAENIPELASAHRYILPASDKTIRVCGTYDESAQKYSALVFNGTVGLCIELQGNVAFYDMTFRMNYAKNFFISANGYSLTIGFHTKAEVASGSTAKIIGGAQDVRAGLSMNPSTEKSTVNIYSGNWDEVYGGPFDGNDRAKATILHPIDVNIFDGTYGNVLARRNNKKSIAAMQKDVTINLYGGTFSKVKNFGSYNSYLNYLEGVDLSSVEVSGFTSNAELKKSDTKIPAPDYAVNYCGVQSTDIADGKYSLRFVGTVDSLNFSAVGFEIIARTTENPDGTDYSKSCSTVYTTINAGTYRKYTAAELGGNYIYALAIKNIPVAAGTVSFEITPFVAVGETVYYGTSYTVTCDSGASIS